MITPPLPFLYFPSLFYFIDDSSLDYSDDRHKDISFSSVIVIGFTYKSLVIIATGPCTLYISLSQRFSLAQHVSFIRSIHDRIFTSLSTLCISFPLTKYSWRLSPASVHLHSLFTVKVYSRWNSISLESRRTLRKTLLLEV